MGNMRCNRHSSAETVDLSTLFLNVILFERSLWTKDYSMDRNLFDYHSYLCNVQIYTY